MDSALGPAAQITAELQKHLELDLEAERSSKDGTAAERERLAILQNETAIGKANADLDKLAHDELTAFIDQQNKEAEEASRKQREDEKQAAEEWKRHREEQVAQGREVADDQIKAAQEQFEFTEREIRYEAELGIISERVAAERLLAAQRLKESQTVGALGKEQGLFDPALGEQQAREYQQLENRMTQEARKGALEREQITQQETLKIMQLYKRLSTEFNTDFQRALDGWITKSETASQAFAKMFGQIELQLINFVAQWLLKKAEQWAMEETLQLLGLTKQHATEAASNAATVTADAAVAAAGAEAAAAPAGPEAMAAAGAAAEVIVLSNLAGASHDTGGVLPHMGLAFNMSGSAERILSPSQTRNFDNMVNNGGARSAILHQQNTFNGSITQDMLQEHTRQTMSQLRRMIRPEAFVCTALPDVPAERCPRPLTFTVVQAFRGTIFKTLVQSAPNEYEVRLPQTVNPIWRWTMMMDFLHDFFWGSFTTVSELRTLMGFLNGQYGQAGSFLFTDPDDNAVGPGITGVSTPNIPLAQLQVVTDGTFYYSPIQRTLDGITYEDITDLNGGITVYADGVFQSSSNYSVLGPGLAIPGASYMGLYLKWVGTPAVPVTAAFNFYFRVRFDGDSLDFEKFLNTGGSNFLAGQGGGYWTIGGSESQNGKGTLVLRTARPTPL